MRRNKLLVCGVVGVFSLISVSAIVLAHTYGGNNYFANANPNKQACELVWDNTTPPTEQGGKLIATGKGAVTQLVYEGVNANRGNNHVVLDLGGKITNTGLAFDPVTGLNGVINSIQSVTVWFEDKAGSLYTPDPNDWEGSEIEVDLGRMMLTAGTNSTISNVKTTTYLTSGVPVDLTKDPHLLADHFYLSFSKDISAPDDATGTCEISKILVTATMEVRYDVTIKDNAGSAVEYYYVNGNTLGEKIEKVHPDDNNHLPGTKIALRYTATDGTSLNADNITVEGATLSSVTLDGEDTPTLVVTVGNSDATVTINEYTAAPVIGDLYPADEYLFVGQHKVYDPSKSTWVDLDVKADGTYTLDTVSGEYTSTDPNKATFNGSGKNRALGVYLKDGLTVVEYARYSNNKCDNLFVGTKGTATPTLNIYLKADNNWEGYLATLGEKTLLVYRNSIVIDGFDGVEIKDIYKESVDADSQILKISQSKPVATLDEDYDLYPNWTIASETVGQVKTLSTYIKQIAGHEFSDTKPDKDILGTFTCPDKPDLVLNGFYHYVWGTKSGTHKVKTWGNPLVIVLEDETVLKLNKSEKTYVEAAKDPLKDGTQRVYTNGTVTFTFDGNGNVLDTRTGKSSAYEFDEYVITGKYKLPYDEAADETGKDVKYTMTISADAQTLTINSYVQTVYVWDYWGDQETSNPTKPLGEDPIVLNLQS